VLDLYGSKYGQWEAIMNAVINLGVSLNAGNSRIPN
jgi:hypothetical protein